MLHSPLIEKALRVAARAHRHQTRKATDIPYFTHPAAVCLILVRAGFDDETALAVALLHDVIEDTDYPQVQLQAEFPAPIPEYVDALTERKMDEDGSRRPWIDRKREQIARVTAAPLVVRAVALADKLHNLTTILYDQTAGEPVWERFNATRDQLLWYHRTLIDAAGRDDERLERLAAQCRTAIERLELA
jgi:(p)ppGpp synthase/HD superfamily hydrolase